MSAANVGAGPHIFRDAAKNVKVGFGHRSVEDIHLTRFASYLVVMNGDPPRKPAIAAAITQRVPPPSGEPPRHKEARILQIRGIYKCETKKDLRA